MFTINKLDKFEQVWSIYLDAFGHFSTHLDVFGQGLDKYGQGLVEFGRGLEEFGEVWRSLKKF